MTTKTRRTLRILYGCPSGQEMDFPPFLPRIEVDDRDFVRVTHYEERYCNPPGYNPTVTGFAL